MEKFTTKLIEQSREFAKHYHDNPSQSQRYGNVPYSCHLESVADNTQRYLYYIKDEDKECVVICSYSHDLIEDTEINFKKIEKMFGYKVADIVFRVSNERGHDRKESNFKTYPKIWTDDLAIFVKLMDRLSNGKNSKLTKHPIYQTYREEYPVFRYALKVRGLYEDAWAEADEIFEYYGV